MPQNFTAFHWVLRISEEGHERSGQEDGTRAATSAASRDGLAPSPMISPSMIFARPWSGAFHPLSESILEAARILNTHCATISKLFKEFV
jgi:hypothetical protein